MWGHKRTFSCLQDERDALPAWVVDPQCERSKSRAHGVLWHRLVFEIARLAVGSYILAEEHIISRNRWDGAQDFNLLEFGQGIARDAAPPLTFSSRISSDEKETGRSIVRMDNTCRRSTHIISVLALSECATTHDFAGCRE